MSFLTLMDPFMTWILGGEPSLKLIVSRERLISPGRGKQRRGVIDL